jgi:hypothetical protein
MPDEPAPLSYWNLRHLGLRPVILALAGEGKGPDEIAAILSEDLHAVVLPESVQKYLDSFKGGQLPLVQAAQARERALLMRESQDQYRRWKERLEAVEAEPEVIPLYDRKGAAVLDPRTGEPMTIPNESRHRRLMDLAQEARSWFEQQKTFHLKKEEREINIGQLVFNPVQVIVESVRKGRMSPLDADQIIDSLQGYAQAQEPGGAFNGSTS